MTERIDEAIRKPETNVALLFALFLLLHLVAAFLLPGAVWGASALRFMPPWAWGVWIVALAVIVTPKTAGFVARIAGSLAEWVDAKGRLGAFVLGAASLALFILFQSRNLFLGDGMILTSVVQNPAEPGMGAAGYVSLTLHKALFGVMRAAVPGTLGSCPFQTTSVLAGVVVVLVARAIARELAEEVAARALIFAAIAGSGAILLFFGYVEHYSLMQAALLLYLYLSIRFLRGKGSLAAPTIALAVTIALHLSAIVLAPSWLLLLIRGKTSPRRTVLLLVPIAIASAAVVIFLGTYMQTYYRGFHLLLPLLREGDHSYALLSMGHASFVLNELLLLLGGVLLFPFLGAARRVPEVGEQGEPVDAEETEETEETEGASSDASVGRFLGGAALIGFLFLLLLDPEIGPRDWDLMALGAFPFALFLGHFFLARRSAIPRGAAAIVIGGIFLHTFPWIAANTDRDRAVTMTVAMTVSDLHYANPAARAPKSFGVILSREGYDEEAALFYKKAADVVGSAQDLFNLGTNKARQGAYAEAIPLLWKAIELEPGYLEAYLNLARAFAASGDSASAEAVLREASEKMPGETLPLKSLGALFVGREHYDEAIELYRRAAEVDPRDADTWSRLALLLARQGDASGAEEAVAKALALDPQNEAALRVKRAIQGDP